MRPLAFAWRGLVREPIRACLGVAGIAVVGALLFDMLLLARGLTLSFAALLEDAGYDVRVTASQFVPSRGPMILDARRRLETLRGIPEIADVAAVRFGRAELDDPGGGPSLQADFMGIDGARRGLWRVIEGGDLAPGAVIVNHRLAERLALGPGDAIALRGACDGPAGARPQTRFTVAGVVRFRFEGDELAAAATRADLLRACEPEEPDAVTMFLVASRPEAGPDRTVTAIAGTLGDLHPFTNRQFVDRLRVTDFSYFTQIAVALSTITSFFAFLLIATLLTVSVNRRLVEVATLRALGLPRGRIAADLLCESALIVGAGALLALPAGAVLAHRLDAILREMPGIPVDLHFFVFRPGAVLLTLGLLCAAALLAAVYPVWLAARLPITATLRREVVS